MLDVPIGNIQGQGQTFVRPAAILQTGYGTLGFGSFAGAGKVHYYRAKIDGDLTGADLMPTSLSEVP